ncbi:MAG: hypothetical protein R8K22_08270, partial [Mariprofundaceae bacterium]
LPEIRVRLDNAARYQVLLRRWVALKTNDELIQGDNYVPFHLDDTTTVRDKAAVRAYGIVRD